MRLKSALIFLCAVVLAPGLARAADVPPDVQKTLAADYALSCAAALDPSDANLDAAFALLGPDFVNVDLKGKESKRAEVIAQGKQQMKQLHATTCDNKLESATMPDANTIVIVNTLHVEGDIQAPDGKHDLYLISRSQDTWKLADGKWLQSNAKDQRVLVKIDGNVVQDQGS